MAQQLHQGEDNQHKSSDGVWCMQPIKRCDTEVQGFNVNPETLLMAQETRDLNISTSTFNVDINMKMR